MIYKMSKIGAGARKSLGQHFLRCRWVANTLIRAAELTKKDTVLEIGPGTGVLTQPLAQHVREVIAVEKDELLAEALRKKAPPNVTVVEGDILRLYRSLYRSKIGTVNTKAIKIVANIPYYLTSRLLRMLLERESQPELIVLTIQKEVAKRIMARPPYMNLLALSVQAFGKPEIIKTVPASCFAPAPEVDSAIIKISDVSDRFFRENGINPGPFFSFIRRGFSQKRKQLLNTLKREGGTPKKAIADVLARLNLSPDARPQELSLQNWADLMKKML